MRAYNRYGDKYFAQETRGLDFNITMPFCNGFYRLHFFWSHNKIRQYGRKYGRIKKHIAGYD